MVRDKRVVAFVVITVVMVLVAAGFGTWAVLRSDRTSDDGSDVGAIGGIGTVAYRNASGGKDEDRLAWSSTTALDQRKLANLKCDRVYFQAAKGICLANNAQRTGFVTKMFDAEARVQHEVPAAGIPSRARISPDGRYGSTTVFVLGHSYSDGNFSTETVIYDMSAGTRLAQLEEFATTRDGKKVDAPDVNYWGVTFTRDSNVFYATLGTGGKKYLVQGDIAARTMKTVREGVECPSLSPDGTRIAYKSAVTNSLWRAHVLDLASGNDVTLAETRSVDDQIEWLDDANVLYGVIEYDIYTVPADGTGAPRLYLNDANSPSVIR